MKKIILFFTGLMLTGMMLSAQSSKGTVEVLYFKANLACCKARACNSLEADIRNIVEAKYQGKGVIFREIKLADEYYKDLIEKFKAKSQTVVLVKINKKKEISEDVTDIVRRYQQGGSKETLEKELFAKIDEIKKKK